MSADDRCTKKEIEAWCLKTFKMYLEKDYKLPYSEIDAPARHYQDHFVELMVKSYRRGYKDALSG